MFLQKMSYEKSIKEIVEGIVDDKDLLETVVLYRAKDTKKGKIAALVEYCENPKSILGGLEPTIRKLEREICS